jgi:hypothetical protein
MNRTTFILELTPAGCLFPFALSLSPMNAEIAALISLHEDLLGYRSKSYHHFSVGKTILRLTNRIH